MTEEVASKPQTKLKLDEEGRRALGQVYRLLLSLAEQGGLDPSETSNVETDLEEKQA
jgi:hypothetical protein